MSFIAGGYSVTFATVSVGQIESGVTLEHRVNKRLITGDNFAQTPQDAVYQGEEAFAEMTMMEYDQAGALDVFWPYSTTFGTMGQVGITDIGDGVSTNKAKALLLTDIDGTPAATKPATLSATYAILAEGYPVRMLFAPDLRDIPVRLRFYPDSSKRLFILA